MTHCDKVFNCIAKTKVLVKFLNYFLFITGTACCAESGTDQSSVAAFNCPRWEIFLFMDNSFFCS